MESTDDMAQRYAGTYVSDRCKVEITAMEKNCVMIKVLWSSSASERTEWTMSGKFDENANYVTYSDCMKKNLTYNKFGYLNSTEDLYVDGRGVFIFNEEGMIWQDLTENIADGMHFTKAI